MSVFRVKNSPFYQYDFQFKGRRFFGSTQTGDEREAKAFEKGRRAEAKRVVEHELATGRRPLTMQIACDRWWEQHGRHGSDSGIRNALDWLIAFFGPHVALHDVNDDLISQAVEARRKDVVRTGKDENGTMLYRPVSNRTVNKTVPSLLSRVFTRARKNWNATILAEPDWTTHFLPVRKRPVREITQDEENAIAAEESADYAQLWEFATIMGLRRREMLLTWPQVDFKLQVIRIIGKGSVPAILPLPPRALEILQGLRGNHKTHVFTFKAQRTRFCTKTRDPKTGDRFKFIRGQRYPMTYHGISTNKQRTWAKAGVDARIHDLRHTAGMRTLRATGNLRLVQGLLRHTDIKTTATFYTDANLTDLRAGLEQTARHQESQKNPQTEILEVVKPQKDKA